jgi:hypothetical protein
MIEEMELAMSESLPPEAFTETHHALLFGWLAQAIVEAAGQPQGEAIVRQAVRRYGAERGGRMAHRAKARGHALTMANYMAYGEWEASPGAAKQALVEKAPHAKLHVFRCPWHTVWNETGLLPYGRLYCLEIDKALVSGFNPQLALEVNGTRTNGAEHCEFVFRDANLPWWSHVWLGYRKTVHPGKQARMPWDYHTGHLFTTLEKVVHVALGEAGQRVTETGLAEFARRFGEPAAQRVLAFRSIDFTRLPA